MAVASTFAVPGAHDHDAFQLRLALEGFHWREETLAPWPDPIVYLHHPHYGSSWFRGWESVEAHHRADWKATCWPLH